MSRLGSPRATRRAGFSLIELVVSVALMGIVLGSVSMFQIRSQDHTEAMLASEKADTTARRALTRVADELRGVGASLLVPDPTTNFGTSDLTFQKPADVTAGGVVVWGAPARLRLELEPGETDDGTDEDGDSLVDERRLVLTRGIGTANEQAVVLCTGIAELGEGEVGNGLDDDGNGLVDESGFSIRRIGDLLNVRITVLVPLPGGESRATSLQTSIVLRN